MKKSRVLSNILGLLPLLSSSPWVGAEPPTSSPPATTESRPSPAATPENTNERASSTATVPTPPVQPMPQSKAPVAHPKPPVTPKTALEEFLGPMLPILAGAEKVEGYIVAPELADASVPEKSKLAGYAVLKGPVIPTETQVKTVQTLLLDEKSYFWGLAKKCLLHPDAALRFLKGSEEVVILLSTECSMWTFAYQGKLNTQDYANKKKEVGDLLTSLFPQDFPTATP